VARAKQLLAVAAGLSYSQAAISSGRKSGDAVAKLVSKFNALGVSAIARKCGGGPKPTYEVAQRERILAAHGAKAAERTAKVEDSVQVPMAGVTRYRCPNCEYVYDETQRAGDLHTIDGFFHELTRYGKR